MLDVSELVKSYGVSFRVERAECFGLLGSNGAGKTTTLRCCLALTSPDSGAIRLGDLPVPGAAPARVRRARRPRRGKDRLPVGGA